MNKSELIESLSKDINLPVKEAAGTVDTILEAMTEALVNGEGVEIRGFCSLTVKNYKSYIGRNPATGIEKKIPPKKAPFFKASKLLKDAVNDGRK